MLSKLKKILAWFLILIRATPKAIQNTGQQVTSITPTAIVQEKQFVFNWEDSIENFPEELLPIYSSNLSIKEPIGWMNSKRELLAAKDEHDVHAPVLMKMRDDIDEVGWIPVEESVITFLESKEKQLELLEKQK